MATCKVHFLTCLLFAETYDLGVSKLFSLDKAAEVIVNDAISCWDKYRLYNMYSIEGAEKGIQCDSFPKEDLRFWTKSMFSV